MKAQNLTICIPNKGCDKNCPYCISKITGKTSPNHQLMRANLKKVIRIARAAQVNSVMLTGKGEPFLNSEAVLEFTGAFSEYPMEVQTNGQWLREHARIILPTLREMGLDIISISVDNMNEPLTGLITEIHKNNMICRVTFNVTLMLVNDSDIWQVDHPARGLSFKSLIKRCNEWGVDQMTLRNVVSPTNFKGLCKQVYWINENTDPRMYEWLREDMKDACKMKGRLLRTLPLGARVYEYEGIAVSYSDYCIQDYNNDNDIRSLIYDEDGHLYTSWDTKASILF